MRFHLDFYPVWSLDISNLRIKSWEQPLLKRVPCGDSVFSPPYSRGPSLENVIDTAIQQETPGIQFPRELSPLTVKLEKVHPESFSPFEEGDSDFEHTSRR